MTTVSYDIHFYGHEDTGSGDCYCVNERVTFHTVTGDEYSEFYVASFSSHDEAAAFIASLSNEEA